MDIYDLVESAHKTAVEKGWWDEPRTPGELIALCHSELSEALEEARKDGVAVAMWRIDGSKPEGFGVELADCVIRIADICGQYHIDLSDMIERKMAYNSTRPHRHGGKRL